MQPLCLKRAIFNFFLLLFFAFNHRLIAQHNNISILKNTITYPFHNCWLEVENYNSYHYNDFYVRNLHEYCILELIPKFGFRVTQPSPVAVEPYVKANLICDGLNNPWNRIDWHNNIVYGFGIRLRRFINFERGSQGDIRMTECHWEFFFEKLWIHYLPKVKSYVGHRPTTDFQFGFQFWLSTLNPFDLKMKNISWGTLKNIWIEVAGSCYYTKSSFYSKLNENFYFLNMNFRAERLIPLTKNKKLLLGPYWITQLSFDPGNKEWNKLDWHNYIQYGFGVRIKFYRHQNFFPGMDNFIFGPYFHFLQKKYWSKVTYIPSYRPHDDFQLGFDLWISINGRNIK